MIYRYSPYNERLLKNHRIKREEKSYNSEAYLLFDRFFTENNWKDKFDYNHWQTELYKLRLYLISNISVVDDEEDYYFGAIYLPSHLEWFCKLCNYIQTNVDENNALKEKYWIICNFPYLIYKNFDNSYWNDVLIKI